MAVVGVPPGEASERDLSWFDTAGLAALSSDGGTLLFGDRFGMYVRPTNGSPAVKLGAAEGYPDDLSPDGKLVLATSLSTDQLSLIPYGAGSAAAPRGGGPPDLLGVAVVPRWPSHPHQREGEGPRPAVLCPRRLGRHAPRP